MSENKSGIKKHAFVKGKNPKTTQKIKNKKRPMPKQNSSVHDIDSPVAVESYNAIEVYINNKNDKEYKGKNVLSVLSDDIMKMGKKEFVELFRYMCNILKKSSEDSETEKEIKYLLVEKSYVFRDKYFEFITDALPLVRKISRKVDFSCTPIFSQDPRPAIYGVDKNNGSGQLPLTAEQIKLIIDAYISHNLLDCAGRWLWEIINFDVSRIWSEVPEDLRKKAIDSAADLRQIASTNASYQAALGYYYFNGGTEEVTKTLNESNIFKNKTIVLENKNAILIQENKLSMEKLEMQNTQIKELRSKVEGYERLREQINDITDKNKKLERRLRLQISINEGIEERHQEKERNLETEIEELIDEMEQLRTELETVSTKNEELANVNNNILSDLEIERIRLSKIKEDTHKQLMDAKNDVIGEFVNLIADPINNFARSFDCFKNNNKFDEMTLEICNDSLGEIISGLRSVGIYPIGEFKAVVPYNRDFHYCEGNVVEGDYVQIAKIGWILGENVIRKADVEKVEE